MSSNPYAHRSMLLSEFEPFVGEWFLADCTPEPVKLQLVEATALRANEYAPRPPFILVFYTPSDVLLLDGIYAMQCGEFGPDMISITSLIKPASAEPGHYYQAIFN